MIVKSILNYFLFPNRFYSVRRTGAKDILIKGGFRRFFQKISLEDMD